MPTLTVNVVIETASERRARQLMGYLLASRDADYGLFCDFTAMADRARDPFLRRALLRVADRYHPRHLIDADRLINDARIRDVERALARPTDPCVVRLKRG